VARWCLKGQATLSLMSLSPHSGFRHITAACLAQRLGAYSALWTPGQSMSCPHPAGRPHRPQPTTARAVSPGIRPRADAPPHGDRYRTLSALSPGPLSGDRHAVSSTAPGRRASYDRTTLMRPCAATPLPCMTDGYSAGRGPVRVPMAAARARRSWLVGTRLCTAVYPGPSDSSAGHPEGGGHSQHASMPVVGDSNSQ
jgi:hypothetical protein